MGTPVKGARGTGYIALNSYWFGLAFLWNGMHSIILPAILLAFVPDALKNTYLGAMTFAGLFMAMLIQPISGALSDSSGAAWGRRRPWIVIGAVGTFISLLILGAAQTYMMLAFSYLLLQSLSNVAHGPLQGLIPDLVPREKRGSASGVKNLLDIGGLLAGVLVAGYFVDRGESRLALVAIIAVMTGALLVTLFGVREQPAKPAAVPLLALVKAAMRHVYRLDYGRYSAYAWLLASRFLVLAGIYAIQGFAQYFIRDVLKSPNPAGATAQLMAIIGIGTAALVYPAGYASDRMGRKTFNVLSAVTCAVGILLLLVVRSYTQLLVVGGILGIGLGSFLSINWALATDLVPANEAGHYLGLSNLATAGAAAASRLGGPVIDLLNRRWMGMGYNALFVLAGCSILLGALLLWRKVQLPVTSPQLLD